MAAMSGNYTARAEPAIAPPSICQEQEQGRGLIESLLEQVDEIEKCLSVVLRPCPPSAVETVANAPRVTGSHMREQALGQNDALRRLRQRLVDIHSRIDL